MYVYIFYCSMNKDKEAHWTCIICRVKPDEIEFKSLDEQELNQRVAFVVDSNYRYDVTFIASQVFLQST